MRNHVDLLFGSLHFKTRGDINHWNHHNFSGKLSWWGKDDWLYSQKVKELNMYFIKVANLD